MNTAILAAFATYFFILLIIGLIAHKKQSTDADFIVGNRSLNYWVIALSAHASDMSAWLFMAFPAAIFLGGLSQWWVALGLLAGMYLNWQLVAKKLRTQTELLQSYTLSTFFERRFKDTSGILRVLTAVMSIVFFASYLSGGLMAMGVLFEKVFGIDYYIGLSVAIFVAMTYTFVGGFATVAWMDLFQAVFLLIMIILVPIVAFSHIPGGVSAILDTAQKNNISMKLINDYSFQTILSIIFLILGWGLGYFGQPHIITKFMGIKDPNHLRNSKYIGMTWMIIALAAAAMVGIVGIGLYPNGLANPELVFVAMVEQLFPAFLGGLILCAVIAANMSTMDSQMLVCASVLSEDIYKKLIRPAATPRELLYASRIALILVGLVSLFIAFDRSSTILAIVLYAWTGLGCAFGPLVLMSLYSKTANKYGAIAGIIVGGVLAGTWHLINPYLTDYKVPAMIPGFFLSLLSIYAVSNLTRQKS